MSQSVVVVGGGAAGMLAALSARAQGASVLLAEPNEKLGRKLYITGKGRCNLTNNTTPEGVLSNVPRNSRFLYSAVTKFPPSAVMAYFESLGVQLKTERGGRVFPVSDKAADVVDALFLALKKSGVQRRVARVTGLWLADGRLSGVFLGEERVSAGAVIVATGGVSYPATGSTGDGYRLAQEAGHTILPPRPSLVPLVEAGETCASMQGLSLKNVTLTLKNQKKKPVFQEQGELLFTHFGLSGPLVLSASAHANWEKERYTAVIDLKPALDEAKLEARLLRDIAQAPNRLFHNFLEGLAPRLLIPVLCDKTGIAPDLPVNALQKGQRRHLIEVMKGLTIPLTGPRPVEEAIVTAGGVKTGEIFPGTMMSKRLPGLFFAGEVLDVDAYTGGFNLQLAWCTGRVAGESAAAYLGTDAAQEIRSDAAAERRCGTGEEERT